jgi:hypothetical protein
MKKIKENIFHIFKCFELYFILEKIKYISTIKQKNKNNIELQYKNIRK